MYLMRNVTNCILAAGLSSLLLAGCHFTSPDAGPGNPDSLAIRKAYASSPVVPAEASVAKMQVEDGFEVKLVAAEPLVNSPVALTFDEKGRMWVIEMQGYMPDTLGTGEEKPTGKIVILEDDDHDGIADKRKVFMDSLVLPRALCLIEDGILVAEPPKLWYVTIKEDKPVDKVLVDSAYAEGGNVEHQPNGLLRALDNWIYNAKSSKRYRKKDSKWLIEKTHARGQWGIAQDDYGRLYYNNNSENLLGDYFLPGLGAGNANQRRVAGFNEKIVADNKVYPARATPGVNRGYMEGILNDSLRLVKFTAASGPAVYRGDLFDPAYHLNVFVPEPSANLIKRNILEEKGYRVSGKQAYKGREFLSSTDERFRPVSMYNGPDGALYVIDFYRGIIQHKTYLTGYLKNEINLRKLHQPLSYGRIYKIIPKNKKPVSTVLPADPKALAGLLQHPNGWIRDKAQQMLIDGKFSQVVPALRQALQQTGKPLQVIHSLWTMEGLGALQPADIIPLLQQNGWPLRMQALSVLPSVMNKGTYQQYLPALEKMLDEKDTLAAPYLAFLAQYIRLYDKQAAERLLISVIKQYPQNMYVADAVISNTYNSETSFLKQVSAINPDTNLIINKQLQRVLVDIKNSKSNKDKKLLVKLYPKGAMLFNSVCQGCHGADGNGIKSLAPPLNTSDWVNGDKNKLVQILLFGLTGPIRVSGTLYEAPEINGDMPGIGNSEEMSDADIAEVASFIRQSWSNNASQISPADVTKVRKKYKGRQKAFTMEELKK